MKKAPENPRLFVTVSHPGFANQHPNLDRTTRTSDCKPQPLSGFDRFLYLPRRRCAHRKYRLSRGENSRYLGESTDQTKSVDVIHGRRHHHQTGCRSCLCRAVEPGTSSHDPSQTCRGSGRVGGVARGVVRMVIPGPFPNISRHVVEPCCVGFFLRDWMSLARRVVTVPTDDV